MRKYIICLVIAGVCLLSYFLFEPIFVYTFGWDSLPNTKSEVFNDQYDAGFKSAIEKSQQLLIDLNGLNSPSASLAVGIENQVIWSAVTGYADVKNEIYTTSETAYRIGSVSKAVTSVALGKALEKGLVQLDDKVISYLPEYPYEDISIRQIASHTSGIRNYDLCLCFPVWEYLSDDHYESVTESLQVFINDPLLFEPGSDFSYSSYNFNLLSAVLEKAYDQSFYDLMKKEVFQPVGMIHSSFDFNPPNLDAVASFYQVDVNQFKDANKVDNSIKWAGGGIISTPSDLVMLGNSLLAGSILSDSQFEILTTPQKIANGAVNEQNYALGWRKHEFTLLNDSKKVTIIHHGGIAAGSTALLLLIPAYDLSLSIMINRSVDGFPLMDIALPIIETFILDIENKINAAINAEGSESATE